MCGLFGSLGRVSSASLDAAAAAIHHRGPDSDGRYVDDRVSLLHARLKIIDLSELAAQPMSTEDGALKLVFNGEIYNHRELRKELSREHTFRSASSDTEVILRGYQTWGAGVIERLDGMFAIAIWDSTRGRLVIARDRAGKKPLFYTTEGTFRFASTIGALVASGHPMGIRLEALPFYLSFGYVPSPETFYSGIRQLRPGERMILDVRDGQAISRVLDRYWEPSFGTNVVTDDYETAKRKVRTLVEGAVESRLESDVPLGAFLSGGIDSTIIVGAMSRRIAKVRTFSIGFAGDPRYDETAYARIAARAFGTDHTEFTLQPSSFELVETLVRHHDGPFGDSSAIPTYVVAQLTRQHVTVALTGDGGDELFCGYSRFLAAEAAEQIPLPLRSLAARVAGFIPASSERGLAGRARRFLAAAALPLDRRITHWTSLFPTPSTLIRADVRAQLASVLDAPPAWQAQMFELAQGRSAMHRVLEHNFRTYLPEDLLVKADRCSMANALESRSPFLDTALIEYAQQLPVGYLRRGTQTKRILKDAFADMLPPEILRRGKMGFGVPLGTWFRGDLRDYMRDHLGPGARVAAYLDSRAVTQILDEHARGTADHGHRIWALLTLEVWLRGLALGPRPLPTP